MPKNGMPKKRLDVALVPVFQNTVERSTAKNY